MNQLITNQSNIYIYIYKVKMKENYNTKVIGNNVILVPYKEHFVPKYHDFMSDEK